jgi:hypothetical protein
LVMGFTCAILWINWLGSTRWSLTSYGYTKAIEDSEKELGCDKEDEICQMKTQDWLWRWERISKLFRVSSKFQREHKIGYGKEMCRRTK